MDCKATVHIGEFSRGGLTRGANKACDHDLGCKETYIPCGIVDEDSGQLSLSFGSSYKTSDFMVDTLASWWNTLDAHEQANTESIQIKIDNGSESSGRWYRGRGRRPGGLRRQATPEVAGKVVVCRQLAQWHCLID